MWIRFIFIKFNFDYLLKILAYANWLTPFWPETTSTWLGYFHVNQILIFLTGWSASISGPLWFVFVLFFASLSFYVIHKSKHSDIIVILIAITMLFGLFADMKYLPFNLYGIEYSLLCMFCGVKFKPHIANKVKNAPTTHLLYSLLAFAVVYTSCSLFCGPMMTYSNAVVENCLYLFSTASGIAILIILFTLLERHNCLSLFRQICRIIAHNALVILPMHMVAKIWIKAFLQPYLPHDILNIISIPFIVVICIISIIIFRGPLHFILQKKKVGWREAMR